MLRRSIQKFLDWCYRTEPGDQSTWTVMCIGGPFDGVPYVGVPVTWRHLDCTFGKYELKQFGFEEHVTTPVFVWEGLHHEEALDAVLDAYQVKRR